MKVDIRDITVYPKVAPKNIIKKYVPTFADIPREPLCSRLK